MDPISPDGEEIYVPRSEPSHPGACLVFDDWREKAATGGFVCGPRSAVARACGVLRNLAICEPVEGRADFRVRLAGTGFVRRYGCDVTGALISQICEPEALPQNLTALNAAKDGTPIFCDARLIRRRRVELQYERILLPVLSPDLAQRWVLSGVFYPDWAR